MTTVSPTDWTVEITHPETGRVRTPDVLDLNDAPSYAPGPKAQPRVRIPVRKSDAWLDAGYADDGELKVWKDGKRLGIEVLRDIEQREDATILIGVGGVELEQRVQREYDDEPRDSVADDLIAETSYTIFTPPGPTNVLRNVTQQNPDSTAEFEAVYSQTDTPIVIENGTVRGAQIAWTREGELADREQTGFDNTTNELEYSGGNYWHGTRGPTTGGPDFAEWDFTPERDIPSAEFGCRVRDAAADGNGAPALEWTLEFPGGSTYLIDELTTVGVGLFTDPGWTDIGDGAYDNAGGYSGPDLTAGDTYTLRVEITDSDGQADLYQYNADAIAPYDKREESALSFPDSTSGGDALSGPAHFVTQTAEFDEEVTAFTVETGEATYAINDTSGGQFIQITNDSGTNWFPDDGNQNNTSSVSLGFSTIGSSIGTRVGLDGFSPNGTRDTIPAENYASQAVDSYELTADISQELLVIEETFDDEIATILTTVAEPAEYTWQFGYNNGNPTITFAPNTVLTSDTTPGIDTRTRERLGKTYESVTIKGSNVPVSNEPLTADVGTPVSLVQDNLLTGEEAVYDDSSNYIRGVDYEIDYTDGEITALSGGSLVDGTQYRVDYKYQAEGTFESPDAPANPNELVREIPGITSTTLAEQTAFVVESIFSEPRYVADVTIPIASAEFDPVEAIEPDAVGIPDESGPLAIRGEPELTTEGLRVRYGSRPETAAIFDRLKRQVARVTKRS